MQSPLLNKRKTTTAATTTTTLTLTHLATHLSVNVLCAFAAAALGGLLFGYVIGVTSGVVAEGALLCDDGDADSARAADFSYDACYDLNDIEKGALTSTNLIGAFVATLFCFRYGDTLGRHRELSLAAALYLIGSVLSALAPSLYFLIAGIFIYGTGIGFAMHAAPVYISEIAPPQVRGLLVSCKEAVIVLGILLGYLASYLFKDVAYNWRWMIGAPPAVLAIALGIFIASQPKSPRWLALAGKDPRDALAHFRPGASAEEVCSETERILASVQDEDAVDDEDSSFGNFLRTYSRSLIVGCGLVALQQVTGQPSVLYYANNIFKAAGLGDNAAIASVTVATVKLLATVVSVLRVDRYGRRTMLFTGIGLMLASLVVLALAFTQQVCTSASVASVSDCDEDDLSVPKAWGYATVLALMVYVSGYQIGFGPVSWLVISEIFPLRVRGSAFSLAAGTNFVSNIVVALLFGEMQAWLGVSGAYVFYAAFCVVSLIFIAVLLPETKGRSLEEIEAIMGYRKVGSGGTGETTAMARRV